MSFPTVLAPVFAQIALIFILLFWLGIARKRAIDAGFQGANEAILNDHVWPKQAMQAHNAFNNQFQMPLLFFVLTALEMITRQADLLFVLLAWVFVVSRYVHAWIHTTSNRISLRFPAYFTGVLVLLVLWIVFAAKLLTGL